jgi:DNA-binding transcriptional MocR family regulator
MTDHSPTEAFPWSASFADRIARMRPSDIREFLKLLGQPGMISFAGGIPDPDLFPVSALEQAAASILSHPVRGPGALQYATSEGYAPLREWIAGYMTRLGAPCTADNILLTTGSQQGLDLLGKLFIDPGDTVLTTAPTYLGALQAFDIYQPIYAAIDLATGERQGAEQPAIAYAMPDFANPSGETVSMEDRHRLLDLAAETGIPVIEDAAYIALRYEGESLPPLLALDIERTGHIDRSRVIFAGTFSKTIAPGLRVGWLCAARPLIQQVVLARQAADLHGSTLDQMLVCDVVRDGFDAQVARIVPVYRQRRDAMLAALERSMPEGVRWTKPEGGMFIWATLPEGLDSRALLRESVDTEGIIFVPGTSFFANGDGGRHLRLNYTRSSEAAIDDGIGRLGALVAHQLGRVAVPSLQGISPPALKWVSP